MAVELTVLRPRIDRPNWGEVIYDGRVIASGNYSDATLLMMAREALSANSKLP